MGKFVDKNSTMKFDGHEVLTIRFFSYSAYGSEVGSAGVKFIPTGGLYVTGGLTPKNMKFIEGQDSPFMKAYNDKGRVGPILEGIPLFAVLVEDLGVRGAHKSAQLECDRYLGSGGESAAAKKKKDDMVMLVHMAVSAVLGLALGFVVAKKK